MSLSLEYVAGLFDGEGSVGIHRQKFHTGKANYSAYLNICNTYLPVLHELRDQFGGSVCTNSRGMSYWYLSGCNTRTFLVEMEKYVMIKKDQVSLVLELLGRIERYSSFRLTDEERQARHELYLACRAAKRCQ